MRGKERPSASISPCSGNNFREVASESRRSIWLAQPDDAMCPDHLPSSAAAGQLIGPLAAVQVQLENTRGATRAKDGHFVLKGRGVWRRLTLQARAIGSVYTATVQEGKPVLRQVDAT